MKQKAKSKFRQMYKNTTFTVSEELSEKMKTPVFTKKIEKAKEIISKIDPVKFKELTGRNLFKK